MLGQKSQKPQGTPKITDHQGAMNVKGEGISPGNALRGTKEKEILLTRQGGNIRGTGGKIRG